MALTDRLAAARLQSGYSQEDVASALGVTRAMVSYWESGKRMPNDRQLSALSRVLRISSQDLLEEDGLTPNEGLAQMLFRGGESDLPPEALPGLREFVQFLDDYEQLAKALGYDIRGMEQSPFTFTAGFDSADDARRKAEEVRSHLRLGLGPVVDMDTACEMLGVTVFRTVLGTDVTKTISGVFFNHRGVGFSILVNVAMTPGRRRFTIAHELAHALFHSKKDRYVISMPGRDPRERFADSFAGEFLMPTEGLRRVMEENGIGPRIKDPADVIHLQRSFKVSYITALVRLRQAKLVDAAHYESLKGIRPVVYARALGYEIEDDEYDQDVSRWRIRRFPPRFLRLLRIAIQQSAISVPTAANLVGLSVDEITELVTDKVGDLPPESAAELREFESTGVPG
jgi:Zn-dependent peptidase ImmA (M78 family)/DNA-binding XRE family transcriptional regulator